MEQEEDDDVVNAEVDHPYLNSKLPEENGEAEPFRNGADTISEGDGGEVPLGPEEGYPFKSGNRWSFIGSFQSPLCLY